ncbi:MAG: IS630 family transposase [bacterium]
MFQTTIRILAVLHPDKDIEAWFEDEARLGLKPTMRRQWTKKGARPIAPSNTRYQWLYTYAFVHPTDGKSFWLLLPTVNATVVSIALREFVAAVDPGNKKMLLLVIDQAGFHIAGDLVVPDNVILRYLPSHTPELQPVESVWPLLREATHNRRFVELTDLQEKLIHRCVYLMDHPDVVYGRIGFSWACCTVKRECIS